MVDPTDAVPKYCRKRGIAVRLDQASTVGSYASTRADTNPEIAYRRPPTNAAPSPYVAAPSGVRFCQFHVAAHAGPPAAPRASTAAAMQVNRLCHAVTMTIIDAVHRH